MYTLKIPSAKYALAALDASKKAGYMGTFLLLARRLDANVEAELRDWWADLDDATGKELLVLVTGLEAEGNASLIESKGVGYFTEGIVALSRFFRMGFERHFEELAAVARRQPEAPPEGASKIRLISPRGISEIRRALQIAEDQLPALLFRANEENREILICLGIEGAPFSPVEIIREIVVNIDDLPAKITNLEWKLGRLEAENVQSSGQLAKQLKSERRYCNAISKASATLEERPALSGRRTPGTEPFDRKKNCVEELRRCRQRIEKIRAHILQIELGRNDISIALATLNERRRTMLVDAATSVLNKLGFAPIQNAASSSRVTFSRVANRAKSRTPDANQKEEFDLFLSHSSHDKPTVRTLAKALKDRGLKVWYDEWELPPGQPWQPVVETGLEKSKAIAVLVRNDRFGPWEDEEMQAAIRMAVEAKRPVIPVLLPGASSKPKLPAFLANRTWVDFRYGVTNEAFNRLKWGIEGKKDAFS